MSETVVITAAGLVALKAEIESLETVGRAEIAERIKTAREWGDLKENSEYHDAKNDQAMLETRILRLREKLLRAEVREPEARTDTVGFGSRVEIEDAATGRRDTFTLVSSTQASPSDGRLSIDSPVGRALSGAREGQRVVFATPRGRRTVVVVAIG